MLTPFTTTGIGSLPHTDADEACAFVLKNVDIPFWPQLPSLSFREYMIPQYTEGMPFLHVDELKKRIWINRDNDSELYRFYETYTDNWLSPISEQYAKGFKAFAQMIEQQRFRYLKGQVTGPLTFTLGLKDSNGKPIFFDEELREISLLLLKAKMRWQVDILKRSSDSVIIFIDEPILSALGTSGYLGVAPSETLRLLREIVDAVDSAGAISGIHCCGKADWPMVIQSNVKIINFDAFDYTETLSLYPREFEIFLARGGYLAWGIVPTTDEIQAVHTATLGKKFRAHMEYLSHSISSELLNARILLTPSCGAGSRSTEEAEKIFRTLGELKHNLATVS